MITRSEFERIAARLGEQGLDDIAWAEGITPPERAEDFALEVIFVICNSGMKNTVARRIYDSVRDALKAGQTAGEVFAHAGKAGAIDRIWRERETLFAEYRAAPDKLAHLKMLPWIGDITCYHLAKNFGLDVAKPDVHLQRLADIHKTTPQELCAALARETGYRVATIDTVLWRACANGVINSKTGAIS